MCTSLPGTMASEDLLAKLTVLHNYIEREFQGVVTAVGDVDLEEIPTGKLHSILTQAHERIQTALARQRMLLWKFAIKSNSAAGHANLAGCERVQVRQGRQNHLRELAVGSFREPKGYGNGGRTSVTPPCRRGLQNSPNNDGDEEAKVNEELEWKRGTLVRMKYLLQRKVGDHTTTEADRAALKRDILKITQALEQVQRQTNGAHAKTRTTTPTRSAEAVEEGVGHRRTSEKSTCRQDERVREGANTTSSSSTFPRSAAVEREQQEGGVSKKNDGCSIQSAGEAGLQLPG